MLNETSKFIRRDTHVHIEKIKILIFNIFHQFPQNKNIMQILMSENRHSVFCSGKTLFTAILW